MAKKIKNNTSIILLILLGSLLFSFTSLKSGLSYPGIGLSFWGPHGHDAIWHISVINQIKQNLPPLNPVFSGSILTNYHWGYDYIAAILSKYILINSLDIYFRVLPLFFSVLIGYLSYKLAFLITKNKKTGLWFAFLNYFAGSFGWLVTMAKSKDIGGESLFWSMQSISTLINPPYALSLIILTAGLILWYRKKSTKNIYWAITIGVLFGILSGIKVYSGVLVGLALSSVFLVNIIKTKKINIFDLTLLVTMASVSFFILISLGVIGKESLLVFKPFWFVHSLIESVDKLYLPRIASLRYNLSNQLLSYKFPILIILEMVFLTIFLFGNMGTRILGIFVIFKKIYKKQISSFDSLILFIMFYAFLFPLLFIQKGTPWNTIQFFYYFLFFANFYFAIFLSNLLIKKNPLNYIFIILIVLLTIPTSYSTLKGYFGYPPPTSIPIVELESLKYLKNQPNGIVLTYPYNKFKKSGVNTPIPLNIYETTSYVSALSEKQTFLEDEMNLDIIGVDWKPRRMEIEKFFNSTDKYFTRGFLIDNNINYIYLLNDQSLPLDPDILQIKQIYNSSCCKIFQVNR